MILSSARIRDFKCIDDSGSVDFERDVTCLVGKNESGKTACLEALYRLSPLSSGGRSKFDELYDYPRRRRAADRESIAGRCPVTATFRLEPEDLQAAAEEYGEGVLASDEVTVARSYDDELHWQLELDERPAVRRLVSTAHLPKGFLRGVTTLDKLDQKLGRLEERTESQEKLKSRLETFDLHERVSEVLAARLPRFLYFDEYSILPGRISIPRLQSTPEDDLTPGERTALAFLRLAGIASDEFLESEYEARKAALEGAANQLTDQIFEFWSQDRGLRVEFDADFRPSRGRSSGGKGVRVNFDGDDDEPVEGAASPPFLEIRIRNERHRLSLNFGERSSGFVWFFSFLAYFSQFRTSERRLVFLLDEPGRSLHPRAQRDLLRFVTESLAEHHPVIYTTHSPFMIEADAFHKVRTVEEDGERGTKVGNDFLAVDPGTLYPLRTALAWELSRTLDVGRYNLIVPKASDVLYLEALSALLGERGRASLDPRWTLVPAAGLYRAALLGALMEEGLERAVVLTTASEVAEAGGYADQFLPRHLLSLAEIAGRDEADLEDLFDRSFYLSLLRSAGLADVRNQGLPDGDRILKIVEDRSGKPVDAYRAAAHFQRQQTVFLKKIGGKDLGRFEDLFRRIRTVFD